MTTISARYALLPDGWAENIEVDVKDDGTIGDVRTEIPAAAQSGRILLPAPANLHSHSFQRAMAGMTEHRSAGRDSFWTWRTLMYQFLDKLTPELIEVIATLVFMEMLEAGYASVGEFHYVHHQPGGAAYDTLSETSQRIFAAAARTEIGLTHLPVLYTYGGVGGADLAGGQLRFGNDLKAFSRLVEEAKSAIASVSADARVGIAPHSLRATVPDELRQATAQFAGGPIHIHVAEQPKEVEEISTWLSARPVEWLLNNIDITDQWCLIHATHMTKAETVAMACSGAIAGLCPITEANLGDGPFNGPAFLQAGGAIGVGSDSNVRISLSEELRQLEYSQRLRDISRNVLVIGEGSVGQALYERVLSGGARALGRPSGAIQEGLLADLVGLDGDHMTFWGLNEKQFLDGWIFASDDRVVRDVWSAGRHCVRDGRHVARYEITRNYNKAMRDLVTDL